MLTNPPTRVPELFTLAEAEANASLTDEQCSITVGSDVIVPADPGLLMVGHVLTRDEIRANECSALDYPDAELWEGTDAAFTATRAEFDLDYLFSEHNVRRMAERGWLLVRTYDVEHPHGDLGYRHRSGLWPLDAELFAKSCKAIEHESIHGLPAGIPPITYNELNSEGGLSEAVDHEAHKAIADAMRAWATRHTDSVVALEPVTGDTEHTDATREH